MSRPTSRASGISSSSRIRKDSYSTRAPLETLVYTLVPTLAPPPRPRSGDNRAGSSSRPESRADLAAEQERKERVLELVEYLQDIINSKASLRSDTSLARLPDAARRLLVQASSQDFSGEGRTNRTDQTGADKALKFSGYWNKIEKGKTLSDPLPHLQFLLALSKLDASDMPANQQPATAADKTRPTASSSSGGVLDEMKVTNVPIPTWSSKGKSKAQVLAAWRTSQSRPPFPTDLLLRDTLYLLQGIDGRYIRFAVRPTKSRENAGVIGQGGSMATEEVVGLDFIADESKDGCINEPTRLQLVQLSEMGVMYKKITTFILDTTSSMDDKRRDMTEQSLCHFLHRELSEYHRLIAVLEAQLTATGGEGDVQHLRGTLGEPGSGSESGLTLLRLGLWTEEMRMKMQMMSDMVDDARSSHGGALVSQIHSRTRHGDPFVRKFMDQILEELSKPFFSTLSKWIFSGELHDPYEEFFVQKNPENREGRASPYHTTGSGDAGFERGMDSAGRGDEAGRAWEKKYVFVKSMVPGFVSEEFAKKIFSTGRSLNFIRYNCGDSDWIETQAKLANAGRVLMYSDLAGLERSIDDAYSIASQRLLEIFFDKFNLLDHLKALKSYLMLGAGDFTELLLEALAPRLAKPAISLYRHHLTSDLESAIRGSNAQYDNPDILRRLDARVLEYTHGEIGWDCFALEYKVEAPLNAVLDSRAMDDYDRLFHHLWRLKRVENAITQGWMRVTSGSRVLEKLPNLSNDWHHCRIVQSEMVHFLRQLQAYCQLEVIECSWAALVEFTSKREGDLDALIAAHRVYLSRVVKKVMLLGNKREKDEMLLDLVREAMDCILQFRDATDDLYAWSLGEATRLDRERDEERGIHSGSTPSDPLKNAEALYKIRDRIRTCSNGFQDRVVGICQLAGTHPDLDIRFLAIRIAFNGHYSLRKSSSGPKSSSGRSVRA